MKYLSLILLSGLILSSCINNEEKIGEAAEDWVQVSPTTFAITNEQNSRLTITMEQFCGSACWIEFDDQVSRSGTVYDITTSALRGSEMCTEQCVRYQRDYQIDLPGPGTYTFRYIVADTTAAEISYTLN